MADEKNRRSEDEPARQGDVLGLSDTPVASGEDDEVRAMAPEPVPRRIVTVPFSTLLTTPMSVLPSSSKSDIATATGDVPAV